MKSKRCIDLVLGAAAIGMLAVSPNWAQAKNSAGTSTRFQRSAVSLEGRYAAALPPIRATAISANTADLGMLSARFTDTDNDGLSDMIEQKYGTDATDADSDEDGVLDGDEIDWNSDTDDDGFINALDPDSDNDQTNDGVERGIVTPHPDTDVEMGHFIAAKPIVEDAASN